MNRRVNRKLIDAWLEKHGPNGVSKLSVKAKVSASTISHARATSEAPKKLSTLQSLSEALEVDLDVLFPSAATDEEAS